MISWRDLNPSYVWKCFNDEEAKTFLEVEFGADFSVPICWRHYLHRRPTFSVSPTSLREAAFMPMLTTVAWRRSTI